VKSSLSRTVPPLDESAAKPSSENTVGTTTAAGTAAKVPWIISLRVIFMNCPLSSQENWFARYDTALEAKSQTVRRTERSVECKVQSLRVP
jgi:hypothetical protein